MGGQLDAWLRADAVPPRLVNAVGWSCVAFWVYYAFLRQVAGPLNPDEIYFSHTLWLLNQGKRQYVDFYSIHLPAYFEILKPLVKALSKGPTDLSFVWGVRSISGAIILTYLGLGWLVTRKALPHAGPVRLLATWAVLLVFVVLARMVEVRTDTFGLLLVNASWALVICSRTARTMAVAALFAGAALLFSARAAGMVTVVGVLLFYLAARSRNTAGVRALLSVAAGVFGAALMAYLAAPDWVSLVVRSCFLEPAKMAHHPQLSARFLASERIPLTLLISGGVAAGAWLVRAGSTERGLLVAVPCAAQLLMIGVDPAPFEYVYGWAAVPAAFGLASVVPRLALCLPALLGAALLGLSIGYRVVYGHVPPTSSYFRLTFDSPLTDREIGRLPTPQLIALLISDAQQKNLANQLHVRSEVCRRLPGTVVTTFDTHPVCLDDAMFYWSGLRWPPLVEGDAAAPGALTHEEFADMFMKARPRVFIWDDRWGSPRTLLPATRRMLACCYDVHAGFALAKEDRHARRAQPE
jgi:hypothetical protein